jgi:hypothetical protein
MADWLKDPVILRRTAMTIAPGIVAILHVLGVQGDAESVIEILILFGLAIGAYFEIRRHLQIKAGQKEPATPQEPSDMSPVTRAIGGVKKRDTKTAETRRMRLTRN